ncbi:putative defense protein 3 isoform X1 [Onthophagus taurus]|uniref:putative defense protein 3 isoform X1 n=1 Tax=Onthophagus taurus TaxID=166361 RepID=UPI000C20CE5F|nr:putative defense protein Hdd11 isoform X2 [Onthophagus taurus]
MGSKLILIPLLALIPVTLSYSGGAPEAVCEDMTPKHPNPPQPPKTFPYKVSVSENEIKSGGRTQITISGDGYKGFLLQVRDGDKPVGSFQIPDDHRYAKTINCSGKRNFEPLLVRIGKMFAEFMHNIIKLDISPLFPQLRPQGSATVLNNAATHKNSATKKELTLDWTAPRGSKGKDYVIYVTVATDGEVYWARQPTETIKVA